ncbi:hypothetical protein BEWA_005400 [Theileria equi strain WA]|uniref:Uncharacterized protein n=1 Tax=Theileria equi strain WA TaxID=1537102 RepID=L0AZU6_THEEQ|nr:hypothetical protein BEWA_005400 [Theileria equi strain WA]AFZ81132.1 hypothetical protein BEWA_005400 [Theileria equi strain WA]|eukprot:XP_004830798.1 hypothetical protein BEWA_005400 [Theileria equi strain WA]
MGNQLYPSLKELTQMNREVQDNPPTAPQTPPSHFQRTPEHAPQGIPPQHAQGSPQKRPQRVPLQHSQGVPQQHPLEVKNRSAKGFMDKVNDQMKSPIIKNEHPFMPHSSHTFNNVILNKQGNYLDLKQRDGLLSAKFKLESPDHNATELLDYLSNNVATCTVRWISVSKEQSRGQMHFDCKFDVKADGFSGETPIVVHIVGFPNTTQAINISTNGFSFHREFNNIFSLKRDIMSALGKDPLHKCRFTKVNGKKFKDDDSAYKALTGHIENGVPQVILEVEPFIKMDINIKNPFSRTVDHFIYNADYVTLSEYKKLLKKEVNAQRFASKILGVDTLHFSLVAINKKFLNPQKYKFKYFKNMPLAMNTLWTFSPYVQVRFHLLEAVVSTHFYPVTAFIKNIVHDGEVIIKKNRRNMKTEYKLYSYAVPGCLEEGGDVYTLIRQQKVSTLDTLPLSESCVSRNSLELNLYYLNDKPTMFNLKVEILNPDNSVSLVRPLTVNYVETARLAYLKDAIILALEKDGHLVSRDDLAFVNIRTFKGEIPNDQTFIADIANIVKEQKLGKTSHIILKASPKIEGIFTDSGGHVRNFKIHLNTTHPSTQDIENAYEAALHNYNILRPEEHIHSHIRFHPMDSKNRVNMRININSDGNYLPPGTRADRIAAESDFRVEIPVNFEYGNNKRIKFTVKIPYGASDEQLQNIIFDELRKRGYKESTQRLYIAVEGNNNKDIGKLWENGLNPNVSLYAQPTVPVDVNGIVHDTPVHFSVNVHPHESLDELDSTILFGMNSNPQLHKWFESDPRHAGEINTIITDSTGKAYSDDDLKGGDLLFNHTDRITLGVSDHPLDLIWKDPLTTKEFTFCFSQRGDGTCRGVPPSILSKFTMQGVGDFLMRMMKKDDTYEKVVKNAVKNRGDLTSTVKLLEIRTIDGTVINCNELPPDSTFTLLEYLYGIQSSHIGALVFSLMTREEHANLSEHFTGHHPHNVIFSKSSGDNESHLVASDDLGPNELENVIYKYFSSVPFGSDLSDIMINDKPYDGRNMSSLYNSSNGGNTPMRVSFKLKDDHQRPHVPIIDSVKIQPKFDETIRDYFERAMNEPGDYGLSPLHSYSVTCIDENGKVVSVQNLLDIPIMNLKMCKSLHFTKGPATGPSAPPHITIATSGKNHGLSEPLELRPNSDDIRTINSKIRNFLIRVPEDHMGDVNILINGQPVKCSLEALREAYIVRNITLDKLLDLCMKKGQEPDLSTVTLKLEMSEKDLENPNGSILTNGLGGDNSPPIAQFTLKNGRSDLGVSSLVKITPGSLKSPLKDFNSRITNMFGSSVSNILGIFLSITKNGRTYPCHLSKSLTKLEDFRKVLLLDIFKACGIPVHIPENGTFYHFNAHVKFFDETKIQTNSMGANVPMDISFNDDDRLSSVHYDEDLHVPIVDYLYDNPNIDLSHMDHYKLTINGEEPTHTMKTKVYNMKNLPSKMSLHDIFPHDSITNVNLQINDINDDNLSGDWKTETVSPAEDFKTNFESLKRQIILRLKTMHGDHLNTINSFVVKVGINGVKHKCQIDNLAKFVSMSLKEFMANCVNIDNVHNNPSMTFGVSYKHPNEKKVFNVKCVCVDQSTVSAKHILEDDTLPEHLMKSLFSKYTGQVLRQVQWSVFINNVQGDCHIDDITKKIKMGDIIRICGVDDSASDIYNITFLDSDADDIGLYNMNMSFTNHGKDDVKSGRIPTNRHSDEQITIESPIHITMPKDYSGPKVTTNPHDSLNDYVRNVIFQEDKQNPGKPVNIKMYANNHLYDMNDIPTKIFNSPTSHLNGKVSLIVDEDPNGDLQGTVTTLHFPQISKPLLEYLTMIKKKDPSWQNKTIFLVNKDSMIKEGHIPNDLLLKPVSELDSLGYSISISNDDVPIKKEESIFVNFISKDGVNSSTSLSDLQESLHALFEKIPGGVVDMDKVGNAKFRIIIDGFNVNCPIDNINMLSGSISLQNLLNVCGVTDLDHSHSVTIYFDAPISKDKKSHDIKFNVNLDDKQGESRSVNYGSEFTLNKNSTDFLKKKDGHVFVDVQSDDGYDEFIEVDSQKFLALLSGHPDVTSMLLKLGIAQEHLGGLHSLNLILSTLTKALQGHQKFSVNNDTNIPFKINEPISQSPYMQKFRDALLKDKNVNLTVVAELANGVVETFDLPNKEFIHALNGNLTFRDLALWGLSAEDADMIKQLRFNTSEPISLDDEKKSQSTKKGNESKKSKEKAPSMTKESLLTSLKVFQEAANDPQKSITLSVKINDGKTYEIIVRNSTIKNAMENNAKMADLLSNYMPKDDIEQVNSISVNLQEQTSTFYVPLKKHKPIAMPIMASDEPKQCMIQEFKNPWNPSESLWKNYTIKEAADAYADYYKIDKKVKGLYLLRKEDHNNMSAKILFDEVQKPSEKSLDRNVGEYISKGYTLFIRYKDTGELAP